MRVIHGMRGFWHSSNQRDADAISCSHSADAPRQRRTRHEPRMQNLRLCAILWPRELKNYRKKGSRFGGRFWGAVPAPLNIFLISRKKMDPKWGPKLGLKSGPRMPPCDANLKPTGTTRMTPTWVTRSPSPRRHVAKAWERETTDSLGALHDSTR